MNGPTVPGWEAVTALLRVFRVPETDIQSRWHTLWVRARAHQLGDPAPDQRPDQPTTITHDPLPGPAGEECASCGSWVVNLERHHAWHWRIENQNPGNPFKKTG